ncbi:ExeM/NucH family extracellular endonuclease [Uliginosibacterium sp. H3]|uniref:ExeM/NucH family extracellular endonuclease n=1 Tax=Uliginosibacterium silvisoli TaxID=3114758 RepID=A0ABU6K5C3_9RHOO|nr:ExeM/NucH family extracellular endonuclease [Uliginosibacterium sp. H3]
MSKTWSFFNVPTSTCLRVALLAALTIGGAARASSSGIVISQVYGGGGNSGATLKNDFIEIFNAGNAPVSLNGWSVQYASSAGTTWAVTPLGNVMLSPGQYYLVQEAVGAGGSVNLPTADVTGTIAMSATTGKVALVSSITALTGAAPTAASIVDLIGFGAASAAEGSSTAALSNTTAALRAANGCTDANNNSADFAIGTPNPRNTASPVNSCGGAPVNAAIVASCPAVALSVGAGGTAAFSATDTDSMVTAASITSPAVAGISLGAVNAASGDGVALTGALNIASTAAAGTYNVQLGFSNNEAQSASCTLSVTIGAAAAFTPIYDIQGAGTASPLAGQSVSTQGVVTAIFAALSGYYIQDETGDGNVLTSDGVFVYSPGGIAVSVGDRVRLNAVVSEYNTITELTGPSGVVVLASGISIAPTSVSLPEVVNGDLERYEGMLVRIDSPMTVAQNYFQGRYGQVTLAAGGRLIKPTNIFRAGSADALALAAENARRVLILDDGSSAQNPNPIPFIAADNTLRAGDSVTNLIGVIDHGLINSDSSATAPRDYKLHPTVVPVFSRDNARTAAPEAVGGNVKVASFNVLNYFTTLNASGGKCYPSMTQSDCRGANSAAEFQRQRSKIVAAMKAINADVFGLMEIENNGTVAAQNLVDALNAEVGAGTYAVVPTPSTGSGTDAIRVAMIYKPGKLSLVGASLSDADSINNRPPMAQAFAAANGEKFSVIVNHMKSKSCGSDGGGDADQNDGQGCYNLRRQKQAQRLLNYFIPVVQAAANDADVLVIGDLNSYGKEDPVLVLTEDSGLFVDQIAKHVTTPYSYIFDGESGYLDHALSSLSLDEQISGASHWHINADEPSVIDYNTEFKPQDLYTASPYRASDHDPVIVGLNLLKRVNGTAGRDSIVGTSGDDVIVGGEAADTLTGGAGRDVFVYQDMRDAGDTILDFTPGTDRIDLHALLVSVGYSGGNAVADGYVRLVTSAAGVIVQIDADGTAGPLGFRPLVLLKGVSFAALDASRDFIY